MFTTLTVVTVSWVYTLVNLSKLAKLFTLSIYNLVCQLYLNETVKKKWTEVKKKGIHSRTYVYNAILKVVFKEQCSICSVLAKFKHFPANVIL